MRRGCAIRKPVRNLTAPGAQVSGDVSAIAAASARATKGCTFTPGRLTTITSKRSRNAVVETRGPCLGGVGRSEPRAMCASRSRRVARLTLLCGTSGPQRRHLFSSEPGGSAGCRACDVGADRLRAVGVLATSRTAIGRRRHSLCPETPHHSQGGSVSRRPVRRLGWCRRWGPGRSLRRR